MINIYSLEKEGIPFYVGKTNNLKRRLNNHRQKYGSQINIFLIDIVEDQKDVWKYWESYWIEQFKQWGFTLLNKNKGGGGTSFHSTETKNKLKKSRKSNPIRNNKPHSELGKQRISKSKKGIPLKNAQKPVEKYSMDYKFIKKYESLNQASLENNISIATICMACKGKIKTAGGYIWKYLNNNFNKVDLKRKSKTVLQFDLQDNLIKEWFNAREVSKELQCYESDISKCCRGGCKTIKKFKWKYKQN